MSTNPYENYKQNSVYGASPEELTLMLYNGLVKFIMLAEEGIRNKNIEKTHNGCIKSQNILYEFIDTLDKKYPVSENLEALYNYMIERLSLANAQKNEKILHEVLGYARELRDTWVEAMKISKNKKKVNSQSKSVDYTSDYKDAQSY